MQLSTALELDPDLRSRITDESDFDGLRGQPRLRAPGHGAYTSIIVVMLILVHSTYKVTCRALGCEWRLLRAFAHDRHGCSRNASTGRCNALHDCARNGECTQPTMLHRPRELMAIALRSARSCQLRDLGTCAGLADSRFVQDSLSDLSFADLAPLPALVADQSVQVLDCDSNRFEPDLRFVLTDFFQLAAPGEMQQVRWRPRRLGLAVGLRY